MPVITHVIRRPLLTALLVSLLAHFLLLASMGRFWTLTPIEIELPIEASLEEVASEHPPQTRKPPASARKSMLPPPLPIRESLNPPLPEPGPGNASPDALEPALAPEVPVEPAVNPVVPEIAPIGAAPEADAAPVRSLRKALRTLPGQLEIKYAVLVGEDGFVAGEAVYLWHARQGRYSLVSTIRATGVTALFVHGNIVQVSEGEVGATGLRPEQYWLKRRGQDMARFHWPQNRLDLGRRGTHELTPQAQDLLSFPFHLAMTTRDGEPEFTLGVTNGRRFKQYDFRNLGRVSLDLGGRKLEVLHLQGRREGEGTLDVWLDSERGGLPVKVRTLDQQGKAMLLVLETLRETAGE